MRESVRRHLLRAQQRMKAQADKRRSERSFNVGDSVYLKLQPYVQSSLAPRAHLKLSFRYYGPYTVLERIGPVAYKLALPPSSSIHPVFHVSLLKPAPSTKYTVVPTTTTTSRYLKLFSSVAFIPDTMVLSLKCLSSGPAWMNRCPPGRMRKHSDSSFLKLQRGDTLQRKEGGDVTAPHLGRPKHDPQPRRSGRAKRRNVKVHGPEWACNKCEAQSE